MPTREKIVLFVVSTGIFFEALDIAIVNLAMPMIQKEFGLTSDAVQWAQTLYILFYGGFLIIGGKLADLVGRKKIFMTGSGIFLLTSLGAGMSPDFEALVIFRAIQGLGAALVIPSAFAIITNTFVEAAIRNKAIGIFGSFAAIGSGSGLSLGGVIATLWGWKWIFFINVPVIGVALILSHLYIPSDSPERRNIKPDFISGLLLTAMIVLITFGIQKFAMMLHHPVYLALFLVLVTVMGLIFLKRSRRPEPLIQFSLFRKREPVTAFCVMLLLGAFFSGYLFLISMILQKQVGLSAAQSGFVLLPFSILSAIVSKAILPAIMKRISIWSGAILGMGLMTAGAVSMLSGVWADNNIVLIVISVACVTGTGIAVCFMTLNVLVVRQIPEQDHGLASSIATTSFFFGGGVGLSMIGLAMQFMTGYEIPVIILGTFGLAGVVILVINYPRRRVVVP
jgi:EmrB/QacA subfamily drug resistance transporter